MANIKITDLTKEINSVLESYGEEVILFSKATEKRSQKMSKKLPQKLRNWE